MAGAAELHAYGAQDTALVPVTAADRDMTRQADRNAAVSGLSAGLSSAIAGLALWGVLVLGVAATGDGTLTRVPLAVLTLTALASFEVVTALPAAAVQLGQARVSGRRIAAVVDAPGPGPRACRAPAAARWPGMGQRCAARRSGTGPATGPLSMASTSTCRRDDGLAWSGRTGRGNPRSPASCSASSN